MSAVMMNDSLKLQEEKAGVRCRHSRVGTVHSQLKYLHFI